MRNIIFGILASFILTACAGSDHRLSQISQDDISKVKQEIATNKYVFKTYNRSDVANRALVSRTSNRLRKNARPLCDYTGYASCFFQIVYDSGDTINAYASENYKITIYRGLLEYLQSEDEVAAVIAHEMGHHLANHNQEKLQNAMVGATVSGLLTAVVLGVANQNNAYYDPYQQQRDKQTVENMTNVGASLGALSYSVDEESEADLLGQYLLARSGYSLKKAERVVWLLMSMSASSGSTQDRAAFGDSHPAGPERIAAWRKVTAEIKNNPSKLPYKAEKMSKGGSE